MLRQRAAWPPFFALAAATEAGRYAILRRALRWAPFLFLFSRIVGPQVLNQKTRESIYLHIQENPGVYYRAILKQLNLAHGTLTHHLYTLERERLIRRHRHGLRMRFFPLSIGAIKSKPLNPWQMQVLEQVRAHPGITQTELARYLGLSRQALHYHVDHLRRSALLSVRAAGRETHLEVGTGEWNRVGRCPRCSNPFEVSSVADPRVRCPACAAEIVRKNTGVGA